MKQIFVGIFNSMSRVDMMAFLLGKSEVVKEILEAEPRTRELLLARKEQELGCSFQEEKR